MGYHINYVKHNKHSYHLILHAELLGMSPTEQVIVAHVARYHRGSPPDRRKHPEYAALPKGTRIRVKRLSALLRIADGLDRGHVAAVERLKVRWMERALRITPVAAPRAKSLRLELWGAARKAGLLERVAGLPVEIALFAVLTIASTYFARRFLRPALAGPDPDLNDPTLRLLGRPAEVVAAFENGRGRVFVDGKEWAAQTEGETEGQAAPETGTRVSVIGVHGAVLTVR